MLRSPKQSTAIMKMPMEIISLSNNKITLRVQGSGNKSVPINLSSSQSCHKLCTAAKSQSIAKYYLGGLRSIPGIKCCTSTLLILGIFAMKKTPFTVEKSIFMANGTEKKKNITSVVWFSSNDLLNTCTRKALLLFSLYCKMMNQDRFSHTFERTAKYFYHTIFPRYFARQILLSNRLQ